MLSRKQGDRNQNGCDREKDRDKDRKAKSKDSPLLSLFLAGHYALNGLYALRIDSLSLTNQKFTGHVGATLD